MIKISLKNFCKVLFVRLNVIITLDTMIILQRVKYVNDAIFQIAKNAKQAEINAVNVMMIQDTW